MRRLLVVGWDAADWKIINPLLARGEMPHLASVIAQGVRANLATIYPPLSPMLWTSIATGKRAYKHGIHGFTEPTQDGLGVRPISNLGRKTKAFWNILNQNGKRCLVVGWWPSHPAEPVHGAMVSNLFPLNPDDDPAAPLVPGAVWPRRLAARMSEMRVHPIEITGEILRLFAPDFEEVDQTRDKSVHDLAAIVAETMSIHAAATALMESEPWDLAAVYFSGIDHFSHRFMRQHAGKPARGKAAAGQERFAPVVANAYRYHDVMLGRLIALAGAECAVMVLSDHGFHSDRLLPDYIPAEAAGPAVEHRDFGIFCLRAPGVVEAGNIYGASVLDIAPTVLHLFGLPAAQDMDGKVLINAFRDRTLLPPIASWDAVAGDDGCHPPARQYDGAASAESLKQLVALGYVAPLDADKRRAVESSVTENRYNLARAYMGGNYAGLAAEILEQLIAADPEQSRFYQHLFQCRLQQHDLSAAGAVLDRFDQASAAFAPAAREELERRNAARADRELTGRPGPDQAEIFARRELTEKAGGFVAERLFLRTQLALSNSRTPEARASARALLEQLSGVVEPRPEFALFLAEGFAVLDQYERAFEYTKRVRRADRENWRVMALEARIHHALGRHQASAECAIESLALVYFQPYLHYLLGRSLAALGEPARAEQSFRVALSQMPGLAPAHDELAALLRDVPARTAESALHLAHAQVLREKLAHRQPRRRVTSLLEPESPSLNEGFDRWTCPPADRSRVVTIVSGLPRSGTSMMMQMLSAAGILPYSDGRRAPDEDNPRGYFEHEHATRLYEDAAWLPAARGKAVKIVAHLLPYLPEGEEYRVVFMLRNLEEVVASQRAMLDRLGRTGASLDARELLRVYTGQLVRVQAWLKSHRAIQVMTVNYAESLRSPDTLACRLAAFLGEPFDQRAAAAQVEEGLRRQRAS